MTDETSDIEACVIAAGMSSRFGSTKLISPFRGRPLIQHALRAAATACPGRVTLVVGHDKDQVLAAGSGLYDRVVVNENYSQGLGTSIAAAAAVGDWSPAAKIIVLADQPLIAASDLGRLIETWSGDSDTVVTARFPGGTGPPTLFPRQYFRALTELDGDRGARQMLADRSCKVRYIDVAAAQFDVDTPDDLRRIEEIGDERDLAN